MKIFKKITLVFLCIILVVLVAATAVLGFY